jgi:hypothetical protein
MRVYPTRTVDYEFDDLGAAGHTGALNDRQFAYLGSLSHIGALSDRFYKFNNDPIIGLFSGSQGVWYDPSNLTTLFQDSAGTTPVTTAGQTVGKILDKSGRGNDATQTGSARPAYATSPDRITLDKVDDRLIVTVPVGGWNGTMVLGTTSGTASYGVDIPAGAYDIGSDGGLYFPATATAGLVGLVIRDGALTGNQKTIVEDFMVVAGATASYGAEASFVNFWRNRSEITSFPLIDTSSGTHFNNAWLNCSGLTSFPLIDTSGAIAFSQTWSGCSGLTSFPLLDMAAGTNLYQSWLNCTSLTSFPALNLLAGTVLTQAWQGCTALTDFPANMFDTCLATNFTGSFVNCALTTTSVNRILTSIEQAGTSGGTLGMTGGTSSAPSAGGITAKNALVARGWTVTTN